MIGKKTYFTGSTASKNSFHLNAAVSKTGRASIIAAVSLAALALGSINAVAAEDEVFTERDLAQTADLSEAVTYVVEDGQNIDITEAGTYVLSGEAQNMTITVDVNKEDKVQLVLDGVTIENEDFPAIYILSADKVFVTTTETENILMTTGTFRTDEENGNNTNAVIFSKDDLVLNGTGTLSIGSSENGINAKDDLKVTGGTYQISALKHAIRANDNIYVNDGIFTIKAKKDALKSGDDDDISSGNIYIYDGTFDITAGSDGLQANVLAEIDGGSITVTSSEGIEGTYVLINDGTVSINASDDGINAVQTSDQYPAAIEINGGDITLVIGAGDTDALDSNGSITINGGNVNISAQSPFDYDGAGSINGGTVIVNGQEVTSMQNSMMGMGRGFGQGGFNQGGFNQGGMPGGRR